MQPADSIHIISTLTCKTELFNKYIVLPKVAIITDTVVAGLYLNMLLADLAGYEVHVITLDPGEQHKNWQAVEKIITFLLQHDFTRDSAIISLGGGVIGDLAGFAAAIYMRGIIWLQIPTTLLAQVDAAIGGKTGCNFLGLKNLIGTFYYPLAVILDIDYLKTLSKREYAAGLAEVVKYGVACDASFFTWIEQQKFAIMQRDSEVLPHLIAQCIAIKQRIVAKDERDHNERMILNFGHCFGHAIEAATNFNQYLHGEAVAIGMLLAARLAVKIGILAPEILDRLSNLLVYWGLPLGKLPALDSCLLYNYMLRDKKGRAGLLNLILPKALGEVTVFNGLNKESLEELLQSHVENELFS